MVDNPGMHGAPGFRETLGYKIRGLNPLGGASNGKDPVYAMFIDFDGTLLTHDHEILPVTLGYLRKAIGENIDIISISGRAPASITNPYTHLMGLQEPLYVAHHGARIERNGVLIPNGHRPLEEKSARLALEIIDSQDGLWPMVDILPFYGNLVPHRADGADRVIEYKGRNPGLDYFTLGEDVPIDKFFGQDDPPDKVVVLTDTPDLARELRGTLEEKLRGEPLQFIISNGTYLELVHKDATKGNAVKAVLDYLRGMDPKHAIGFGDGESDLTMADHIRLYLMANASDDVKERARKMKNVTILEHTNEEDGIGRVIAELILNEPYTAERVPSSTQ